MLNVFCNKIIQYIVNNFYKFNNYLYGFPPEPILYITNLNSNNKYISLKNIFDVNYKSLIANCDTIFYEYVNLDINELRNSKLEYIEFNNILEFIKYYKNFQTILDNLPETLLYLSINYNEYIYIDKLQLINENGDQINNMKYNNLPIGLKTLEIIYSDSDLDLDKLNKFSKNNFNNSKLEFGHVSIMSLPPNLETLKLVCNRLSNTIDNLPFSLKTLHINCVHLETTFDKLPLNLEKLFINVRLENINDIKHTNILKSLNKLPNSIKELTLFIDIGNPDGIMIDKLPDNLEYLRISNSSDFIKYNKTYENRFKFEISTLPKKIETVIIVNNCISNSHELEIKYPDITFGYFEIQ